MSGAGRKGQGTAPYKEVPAMHAGRAVLSDAIVSGKAEQGVVLIKKSEINWMHTVEEAFRHFSRRKIMKINNYKALMEEGESIRKSLTEAVEKANAAWEAAGRPSDSKWCLGLELESIERDHRLMWEMTLLRAAHHGCPAADIDKAEAELDI